MVNICLNIPGQFLQCEATLRQQEFDLMIMGSLNKPVMCKGAVFLYLIIPTIKDCIGALSLVGLFNDSFNLKTGHSPVYSTLDICGLTSAGIRHL